MKSFKSGNYRSAELQFRDLINADNSDYTDQARFYYALSIYYQKKFKSAIFEFNSFLNKSTSAVLQTEARFWIGEAYFYLFDYVKAIELFKRYIKGSNNIPLKIRARDRIGTIYYSQKRFEEAIIEWKKAITVSNNKEQNGRLLVQIGDAYFNNRNYNEALKIMNRIITSRNNATVIAKAKIIIGRIFQIKKRHGSALILFNGIPKKIQDLKAFAEINYYKALSNIKLNRVERAKTQLKIYLIRGRKQNPLYYQAQLKLGSILIYSKDEKQGIENLSTVVNNAPQKELRTKASLLLANLYIKRKPALAIGYLNKVLSSNRPDLSKKALLLLAKAYIKTKKFSLAMQYLNAFSKKHPYDSIDEVDFLKGRVFLEMKNISQAIVVFEKLKKEHPFSKYINEINFYLALAKISASGMKLKKNRDMAIGLLLAYLRKGTSDNRYETYTLLINLYLKNNNIYQARRFTNILIRQYAKHKDVEKIIYLLALSLQKKNMNAQYYINLLLKKYPDTKTTITLYYKLGNTFFQRKIYNKAAQYYTKYILSNDKSYYGEAYYNRLLALFFEKKYEEVIQIILEKQKPLLTIKQWQKVQLLLCRSYYNLGKYDKVFMYMDINNVKKYPIDDLMIYLKSALKVGDVQTAAEISKFMTKNNLRYAEALFLIGNFYLLKENNDIAKGFYSRIIVECPNSPYLDLAKIKLTEMYIKDKNYTTAITQIKSIANKKFTFKKKALLALVYLESKKIKESEKLTRTIFYKILNDKHGEILIKKLFLYYYKKKNLIKFRLYSNYLNRFRGNQILINKLSARFYYYAKNYSLSFFYYYRLSTQKVELDEAFFFLGKISLLYHRNKRNAMRYLTKVIKDKKSTNMYKYNALYELAILAKESRNNKKSKEYLKKIISTSPKREIKEKAKNLLEYYKF